MKKIYLASKNKFRIVPSINKDLLWIFDHNGDFVGLLPIKDWSFYVKD